MNSSALVMPIIGSNEFNYARLIAELNAVIGFNEKQLNDVAESMGLELTDIQEIIDRADAVFEFAKATITGKIVSAQYVSVWDGGEVSTNCTFNTETLEITDIEVSDVDFSYETLEREYLVFTHKGKDYEIGAEEGELTDEGRLEFEAIQGAKK